MTAYNLISHQNTHIGSLPSIKNYINQVLELARPHFHGGTLKSKVNFYAKPGELRPVNFAAK